MKVRAYHRDERRKHAKYNAGQVVRYILSGAWKTDKPLFALMGIYTLVLAATPFIGVFFPRYIIDELTGAGDPARLMWLVGGMLGTAALFGVIEKTSLHAQAHRVFRLRTRLTQQHALKCMTTAFRNTEDSDFLDRAHLAEQGLWRMEATIETVFELGGQMLGLAGYVAVISTLSPWLLLWLGMSVGVVYLITYFVERYEYRLQDDIAGVERRGAYLYSVLYDFAYGKDIRIFRLSRWLLRRFIDSRKERLGYTRSIQNHRFFLGIWHLPNNLLRDGAVYAYLIWQVCTGALTIGEFTMYLTAISAFSGWMISLINNVLFIVRESWYISELREFTEPEEAENTDTLPLPKAPYTIEFSHVRFRYPGAERDVYTDLSLTIPAGEKLAIVGKNGAGKTTFIKLLCRLYEPDEGQILLNGVDIRRFDRDEYAMLFSPVFQDVKVTAFSLAENVAATDADTLDRERVETVLRQADLFEKAASLPKGIDTPMLRMMEDDGVELSGGEKQKLSFARALYKDAPIMLLDEPTAALDAIAEANTYRAFDRLIGQKTAVYISHRLASTHFCDRIAFFEDGQLTECGTHDELMAQNGAYRRMFDVQAAYYRKGATADVDSE
ncbi:MAG: ABC transporter ATP-binding protein [Clostridia bacterium]|nr:ABC transporter ATP-binding protein [Clostridia bacterium]